MNELQGHSTKKKSGTATAVPDGINIGASEFSKISLYFCHPTTRDMSSNASLSPNSGTSGLTFPWESCPSQQLDRDLEQMPELQTPASLPLTFGSSRRTQAQGLQVEANDGSYIEGISPAFVDCLAQQYSLNERQHGNLRAVYQVFLTNLKL